MEIVREDRDAPRRWRDPLLHRRRYAAACGFVELDFCISFSGILTFRNAECDPSGSRAWCRTIAVMVETDAPYLAPEPYRGKRNEPAFRGQNVGSARAHPRPRAG